MPDFPFDSAPFQAPDDVVSAPRTFRRTVQKDEHDGIDYVLRTARDRKVKFVRLWFTDILGIMKAWRLSPTNWKPRSKRASLSTAPLSKVFRAKPKAT